MISTFYGLVAGECSLPSYKGGGIIIQLDGRMGFSFFSQLDTLKKASGLTTGIMMIKCVRVQ
jgi:hypothetical protein